MAYNINIVVLSGEITWVKLKYTSAKKIFASFAVKQPLLVTEGGVVVIKDYNYFFCSCFEESLYSSGYLKEGVQATVQGKLSPYKTDEGNFSVSIIVERIDFH